MIRSFYLHQRRPRVYAVCSFEKKRRFIVSIIATYKKGKRWRKAILQIGAISLVVIAAGVMVSPIHIGGLLLIGDCPAEGRTAKHMIISLDVARSLCTSLSAVFVDARPSNDYLEKHILCARSLPLENVDEYFGSAMEEGAGDCDDIPQEKTIVVYGEEDCPCVEKLANEFFLRGYENVKVLFNGWPRWVEAGFPTAKGGG